MLFNHLLNGMFLQVLRKFKDLVYSWGPAAETHGSNQWRVPVKVKFQFPEHTNVCIDYLPHCEPGFGQSPKLYIAKPIVNLWIAMQHSTYPYSVF